MDRINGLNVGSLTPSRSSASRATPSARLWQVARTPATLVSRFVLALVFGIGAITKITAPGLFISDVLAYHMVPTQFVTPFALALPWGEALLAVYLIVGLFLRLTAITTAGLLVMFIAVLSISLANGDTNHSCGCLPSSGPLGSLPLVAWLAGGSTITPFDVIRDGVFLVMSGMIVWGDRQTLALDALLFSRNANQDFDDTDDLEGTTND